MAEQAAAQGLRFIDDLTRFSQQMSENRGLLLRWVLPFDGELYRCAAMQTLT